MIIEQSRTANVAVTAAHKFYYGTVTVHALFSNQAVIYRCAVVASYTNRAVTEMAPTVTALFIYFLVI